MDNDSKPKRVRGRQLPLCALALAAGAGLGLIIEKGLSTRDAAPSGLALNFTEQVESDRSEFAPPTLRSSDTIDDILQAEFATRYGRLALWSLDASSSDLEAMFGSLLEQETFWLLCRLLKK